MIYQAQLQDFFGRWWNVRGVSAEHSKVALPAVDILERGFWRSKRMCVYKMRVTIVGSSAHKEAVNG